MSLSDRPEGSQRGGGYRRGLGEEDCSIFLASGEEINKQEMLQTIQDRHVQRKVASSWSGLWTSGGEVLNGEEMLVQRTE